MLGVGYEHSGNGWSSGYVKLSNCLRQHTVSMPAGAAPSASLSLEMLSQHPIVCAGMIEMGRILL